MDACVALNLLATGELDAIAESLGVTFVMADVAAAESLYLIEVVDGATERIQVQLDLHIDKGSLQLFELAGEAELQTFIELASEIDDGEAASLALAIHRDLVIATDDRKAQRVALQRRLPKLESTPSILKRFTAAASLKPEEVRLLLLMVERRSSFRPPRSSPNFDWWSANTR
ncbi:hypothetical protein GCM10029978_075120 [Actinoallomurus acanthiterrae]